MPNIASLDRELQCKLVETIDHQVFCPPQWFLLVIDRSTTEHDLYFLFSALPEITW